MGLLKDKIIIVTGGSLGIGYAVAEKCAEAGAKVIIASRTEDDLKAAVKKLNEINKSCNSYKVLNVGNKDQVKEFACEIREKSGYIDGLINCAGIYGPIGPLDEIDIDNFAQTININLMGTVFMCHYFTSLMKNKGGKIINYSGGGAATPFPNYSAYAVSKTGIVRLTENLSQEFKPYGIAVNCVAPGFIITRLHQQTLAAGEKAGSSFLKNTEEQINKGGVPLEVPARLTVFLLSHKADGITGKFISAPWDPWETADFIQRLKTDKDFATLRRIDDKTFFVKGKDN